jgi:hypothetical protein
LNAIDGKEEELIAEPMAIQQKNIACYNRQRIVGNNVRKSPSSEPLKTRILAQFTAQNGGISEVKPPLSMPNGVTQPLTAAQIALQAQQETAATTTTSTATSTSQSTPAKNPASRQYTIQTPYGSVMRFSKPKSTPTRNRTSTKTSVSAARIAVQQAQQAQVHSIRMTGPQLTAFLQQNPGLQSRIIVQQTSSGMATVVQPTTGGIKPQIITAPTGDCAQILNSIVASALNEENPDTSQNQSSVPNAQPVTTSVDMSLQRVIASIQSHALSQSRLTNTGTPEETHTSIPSGGSREITVANSVAEGPVSASSSRSSTPQLLQDGLVPSMSQLLDEELLSAQSTTTIRVGSPPNPTQATVHHHPPVSNQSNRDDNDPSSHFMHGSMSAAKILTISRASIDSKTAGSTSGASVVTLPMSTTVPVVSTDPSSGLYKVTRLTNRPGTISYLPTGSVATAVPVTIGQKNTFNVTSSDSDAFLGEFLNFAQTQSKQRFGDLKRTAVRNIQAPTSAKVLRQSVPATVTAVSAAPRLPIVNAMSSADILAQSVNCLNTVVAGLDEGETNSDNMATVSSVDDQNISNFLADIGENSADSDSIRDDILGQALSLSEIEPMSPLDGNEFSTLDGTDLGANTAPLLESIPTNTLGIGPQTNFNPVITTVSQPQTVLGGDLRLIQGTNGPILTSNVVSTGQVISTPGMSVATSLPHILTQAGIQQQYVISGQLPTVQHVQGIPQIQQVVNTGAVQQVVNSGAVQMSQAIHVPQGTIIQSVATVTPQTSVQIVTNTGQVQPAPLQVANIRNDNPSIQALLQVSILSLTCLTLQ